MLRRVALGAIVAIGLGCADSQPLDFGTADVAGTGGTTATGGTTGLAGAAGTGGSAGTSGGAGGHGGAAVSSVAGATGTGGVKATGGANGAAGATGAGGAAVTFTQIYKTILTAHCAGSACHNPGSQQGVNFKTQALGYSSIQAFIIPGDAEDSTFWEAVDLGDMPRNAKKLADADIASIKTWIDAGAAND